MMASSGVPARSQNARLRSLHTVIAALRKGTVRPTAALCSSITIGEIDVSFCTTTVGTPTAAKRSMTGRR